MSEEENKQHSTLEEKASELRAMLIPELNLGKFLFLGVLAFLFSSLEPFALFASIPFTISFLLYGKWKTLGLGVVGTILAVALLQVKFYQGSALGTFPLSLFYGYLISNSIKRKETPLKGILINGLSIFTIVMVGLVVFNFSQKEGIRGVLFPYVQKTATQYYNNVEKVAGVPLEQLRHLKDIMENPDIVVQPILNYGVSVIFIGIFLSFWVGTFVALKMAPLWKPFHSYPHTIKKLTNFKVPFEVVYPLIAGLVLAVGASYEFVGPWADIVGFNILLMLGIFYFFQGFGVLSELLNYWRVYGFFRTMVVFFAVIMAYQVMALVGVLDTWVDFRKFFNKSKNEGDKQ